MHKRTPSYRLHKASGQAVVTIEGRDHYLGTFDAPASRAEYDRLIAEWLQHGRRLPPADAKNDLTVSELALAYLRFADGYYRRPDGSPTSEPAVLRLALRPMLKLYGHTLCAEFGPRRLETVRDAMIDEGRVRNQINLGIRRLVRMFKWATSKELVPPSVFHALQTLSGLARGRSRAAERPPVKPVPDAHVEAIRPYVTKPIWGAIRLQLLTGMRSGEVLSMRAADINMAGPVWEYRPPAHKNSYRGHDRVVMLGPKAQAVVKEFLSTDIEAHLFRPADGRQEYIAGNYRAGATINRTGRRPSACYSVESYQVAVRRACVKANVPHWHPHQLRHSAATWLRREFGIEAARTILGHKHCGVTELYAELDQEKARAAMSKVG